MTQKNEILTKNSKGYTALNTKISNPRPNLFDYKSLMVQYNRMEITAIMVLDYPPKNMPNLKACLKSRGLQNNIDYVCMGSKEGKEKFTVFLKKISTKLAKEQ